MADTFDFDAFVSRLSAEEKKFFDSSMQKVPELKEGWMRQGDYSRKTAELAAKRREVEAEQTTWKAWADKTVPVYDSLVAEGAIDEDGHHLWKQREDALKAQIEAANAKVLSGGDMDPAELDRIVTEKVNGIVKAAGGANKEEITALIASETAKVIGSSFDTRYAAVKKDFDEKTIPFVMDWATDVALAGMKYEKETGKEFDEEAKAEFKVFMTKEQNFKPRTAIMDFIKPTLVARQMEKDIETRAEKRAIELMKERGGVPGGGDEPFTAGAPRLQGSLQKMLDMSEDKGDIESQIKAAGSKGAAELREAGVTY